MTCRSCNGTGVIVENIATLYDRVSYRIEICHCQAGRKLACSTSQTTPHIDQFSTPDEIKEQDQ